MIVTKVRHEWPNPPGFCLNREAGHPDYTFVHFTTGITLRLEGKEVRVSEHGCIIYRPGTPQYFTCDGEMLHDWFHFQGVDEGFFQRLGLSPDTLFYPRQSRFITDLIRETETEFFSDHPHREEMMDLKIRELFIKLRRVTEEPGKSIVPEVPERFRDLRRKILQFPGRSWTVAEMAREASLSPSRFFELYRTCYGISPVEDRINARIDAAKSALQFTARPVGEIARSLGYANETHFCRQFRSRTGMAPGQYRKNKTGAPAAPTGMGDGGTVRPEKEPSHPHK